MTAPLVVFPFHYKDARTGRWVKARYKAERSEIAARYAEWEITGPAKFDSSGWHLLVYGVVVGESEEAVRAVVNRLRVQDGYVSQRSESSG